MGERWGINDEERTTRLVPREQTIRARRTRLEQANEQTIRLVQVERIGLERARRIGLERARRTRLGQAIEQTIGLERARRTRLGQAIERIGPIIIGANKIYEIVYYWVDDLSLDCLILDSLLEAIDWYVLGVLILVHLWVILGLVLNGIVISHYTLTGNLDDLAHFLVFHDGLLVGHVLDTTLSTNGLLSDYGLLHHGNGGNRLL